MPDFSSVNVKSNPGVATLINPQYVASVKHNGGYKNVSFGDGENRYNIVDRNEHGSQDFHAPRLDKLVTEVIPASVTEEGQKTNAYANTERYTAFYRAGSGTQYIKDKSGNVTQISGAYSYLTGGLSGRHLHLTILLQVVPEMFLTRLMVLCPVTGHRETVDLLYLPMIHGRKMG